MASIKDFGKVKDIAKVVYGKVYGLLEDDAKINDYIKRAEDLIKKFPGGRLDDIADTLDDVRIYVLLVRDYLYKEYRDIKKRSVIIALAGAIYTISPIDLIPDSFGLIGLIDDAAVLKLVNKVLEEEVDKYKDWRKEVGKDPIEEDDEEDDD